MTSSTCPADTRRNYEIQSSRSSSLQQALRLSLVLCRANRVAKLWRKTWGVTSLIPTERQACVNATLIYVVLRIFWQKRVREAIRRRLSRYDTNSRETLCAHVITSLKYQALLNESVGSVTKNLVDFLGLEW